MNRRRLTGILVTIGVLLALLAAAVAIFYQPLTTALMNNMVRRAMISRNVQYEDGIYAGLCGSGAPMPDLQRAGPCVTVLAGKHAFIVDAGEGSARNVLLMNFPIGRTDAVLLTHFHSDHISDLGEIELQRWVGGANQSPLAVIGPPGVEQVVEGFNLAYRLDAGYRVAHHGPETAPPTGAGAVARPFALADTPDASAVVFDQDGVKVTAFKVDHRPVEPAVGYRIDYQGRSLVISGDTVYSASLLEQARGADLLFHEALNKTMVGLMNANADASPSPTISRITHDIPGYHSSPEDAARLASQAGVRCLVYYHIVPPLPSPILKNLFLGEARSSFRGPITLGEDGMLFFLPAGSDQIEMKQLFD